MLVLLASSAAMPGLALTTSKEVLLAHWVEILKTVMGTDQTQSVQN
jgi:hypothetical protein